MILHSFCCIYGCCFILFLLYFCQLPACINSRVKIHMIKNLRFHPASFSIPIVYLLSFFLECNAHKIDKFNPSVLRFVDQPLITANLVEFYNVVPELTLFS